MKQIDLFELRHYPTSPGYKETTTSRDAARAIAPAADILREKVYAAFKAAGDRGLTADEAARNIMADKYSVRPRVTELSKETPPRIKRTEQRRQNESRQKAIVWRIA
jgi:hypothetical protein